MLHKVLPLPRKESRYPFRRPKWRQVLYQSPDRSAEAVFLQEYGQHLSSAYLSLNLNVLREDRLFEAYISQHFCAIMGAYAQNNRSEGES